MAVQRKCPSCDTWNQNNDYCTLCNTLLSPIIIEEQREEIREQQRQKPPTKLDLFLHNWEHSRFLLLRILYKIIYTISVIFFAVASFFAWLAATPNG